jgi:mRNA-degrading endonuclease RelE of RelBE toxin-antitoxin system
MFTIKFSQKAIKDLKSLKKKFRKIEEDLDKLFAFLSRGTFGDKRIKNWQLSPFNKYNGEIN